MAEKYYSVGDEVSVSGVVTAVGSNGGNPEVTVALNDENVERPVSVGQPVHPAAFANGPLELAEANQKTYDEAAKASEEAQRELDKQNAADEEAAAENSGDNKVSDEAKVPDSSKVPATNSVSTKSVTAKK